MRVKKRARRRAWGPLSLNRTGWLHFTSVTCRLPFGRTWVIWERG